MLSTTEKTNLTKQLPKSETLSKTNSIPTTRATNKFIRRIKNFTHKHWLFEKQSALLIGVSGGPDSACLLDVLARLRPLYQLTLRIAHVNYGTRPKDSDADEQFVRTLAKHYQLDISVLKIDTIKKYDENSLREIRYDFFQKEKERHNLDAIAVGHNKDDQAETILLHIFRGCALNGLSGMSARNKNIIRPLLEVSRDEILDYLTHNNLDYHEDSSNASPFYMRNRLRHHIIPILKKECNPLIEDALTRLARTAAEDARFIEDQATKECALHNQRNQKEGNVTLSVRHMSMLPPSLRRACLYSTLNSVKLTNQEITLSHIDEIEKVLRSTKNKSQQITFCDLKIIRRGDTVTIMNITKNLNYTHGKNV